MAKGGEEGSAQEDIDGARVVHPVLRRRYSNSLSAAVQAARRQRSRAVEEGAATHAVRVLHLHHRRAHLILDLITDVEERHARSLTHALELSTSTHPNRVTGSRVRRAWPRGITGSRVRRAWPRGVTGSRVRSTCPNRCTSANGHGHAVGARSQQGHASHTHTAFEYSSVRALDRSCPSLRPPVSRLALACHCTSSTGGAPIVTTCGEREARPRVDESTRVLSRARAG